MKVMVFDVGGTEIKYSVMDEGLNRTDAGSVPTPQDTQEHFLDTLYALYAPHRDEVSGIAMALPGFVDTHTGFVSNGGALLYNTGTQVGRLVRERCGCPVTLENDGKAAALAELQAGALQGCATRRCLSSAPVWAWRHHRQRPAGAGHPFYRRGIQLCEHQRRRVGEYRKNHGLSVQHQIPAQVVPRRKGLPADAPMNGKLFFDAANAAEPEALEVLERFCKMVAVQIYNLTVLLDVEKVAIGGGHQQAAAAAGRSAPGICRAVCFPWGITLHDRSAPLRDRALPFQQRSQSGGSIVYLSAGGKQNHLMASASL